MPDKELTSVQRYVLLTLMISAAPLEYRTIKNSLSADKRNELENWEYIAVGGRPMTLELTQLGHDRAVAELGGERPNGSGTTGLVLYAALGFARKLIEQTGTKPQDLFRLRLAAPSALPPDADLEKQTS